MNVKEQAITQGVPALEFVQQLQPQAMVNLLQMLPASGLVGSAKQSLTLQAAALLQTQEQTHLQVQWLLRACWSICSSADGIEGKH